MIRGLWILSAIILAGCGQYDSDTTLELAAKNAVKARLVDPSSAVFSDVRVGREPVDPEAESTSQRAFVCGYVNAKNRMGGFSGRTRFVSHISLHHDFGSYGTGHVSIEDRKSRTASIATHNTDRPQTVFEELDWNAYCHYAGFHNTFTGERW